MRAASTAVWLILMQACAGSDQAPPPGTRKSTHPASDAGTASDASSMQARPALAPILPAADDDIELPFAAAPVDYSIAVEAQPGVLDVQFSVDTTASMTAEIDQLQMDMATVIAPGLRKRVASVSFGVSRFADFPLTPFGFAGESGRSADTPFALLTPVTSALSRVTSAVARLDQPLDEGGDLAEAGAEALWQVATGEGYQVDGQMLISGFKGPPKEGGGDGGGVGFRAGALRVVLHVTDAPSHRPQDYEPWFPGTHGMPEATEALAAINAKLVGIVSGACSDSDATGECNGAAHALARSELERIALVTGALGKEPEPDGCPSGVDGAWVPALEGTCPLVFDVDERGKGLSKAMLDGIVGLLDGTRFGVVTGQVSDDPLGFVRDVAPHPPTGKTDLPAIVDRLPLGKPDGRPDSFGQVPSKTRLLFDVKLQNRRIRSSDVEQIFRVVIEIVGDGLILERRTLRIHVPAGPSLAPDSDAGDFEDAGE